MAAPGTEYTFTVVAKDAAGNASKHSEPVTARTQTGGGGGDRTFSNGNDVPIRDFQVAISPLRSTATGAAAAQVAVEVTASHTCTHPGTEDVHRPTGPW